MWHWLPNLQLKKHNYFWLKLASFSFLGHLILLLMALYSHQKAKVSLTVFSKPRGIEVVFVPLYKKVPLAQSKINQAKMAQANPKASLKKASKSLPVKNLPVKALPAKPVPAKKVQEQKVLPKKAIVKLKEQVVKIKPEIKTEIKAQVEPETQVTSKQELLPNEPIYIGRQDLKDLQMFGELEAVLMQNWQPPAGFGADVECVVELVSGAQGEILSLVIKKSSQILAYDMSVRRNFNEMILPKSASNKTFTIVFRP